MTIFRKVGLLTCCLSLPVSAAMIAYRDRATAPARQTNQAELADKSANGISPVPTSPSHSELVEMELLKRVYILPSNNCGWYADYSAESYTCARVSASCVNIGDFRGCCLGPTTDCATTLFNTYCIPFESLTVSGSTEPCGSDTQCCSSTEYPDCGTIFYSQSADDYSKTYTMIDCWASAYGGTYGMQDYPPNGRTRVRSTSSTSTPTPSPTPTPTSTPTPTPTPTQSDDPKPAPIGPIVGGVIGGLAVIGAVILGIVYIKHRKGAHPKPAPLPQMDEYHDFSQPSEMPGTDPTKIGWSPGSDGGASPVRFQAQVAPGLNEVPATPVGAGGRAELG